MPSDLVISYKDLTLESMLSPGPRLSIPLPPPSDDRRRTLKQIIKEELSSETSREADVNVTNAARKYNLGIIGKPIDYSGVGATGGRKSVSIPPLSATNDVQMHESV